MFVSIVGILVCICYLILWYWATANRNKSTIPDAEKYTTDRLRRLRDAQAQFKQVKSQLKELIPELLSDTANDLLVKDNVEIAELRESERQTSSDKRQFRHLLFNGIASIPPAAFSIYLPQYLKWDVNTVRGIVDLVISAIHQSSG